MTASTLLAAAGVAWGIYDSLKRGAPGAPGAHAAAAAPGSAMGLMSTTAAAMVPADVLRIVRLAISAARADGELSAPERALILEHARRTGVEAEVERELAHPQPLADVVRGVTDVSARHDLYTLAFTIVRADETVTGGERIYLAQLAHKLGIDASTAAQLETAAVGSIDG